MLRRTGTAIAVLILAAGALELGESLHRTGQIGFVTAAEARAGHPATPVSVAGVARRTTRRCAADVYDC
jgi:hypothetical protein